MLRQHGGRLQAYIAKKDLEEYVVDQEHPGAWGGWIELGNGWRLELPAMAAAPRLPITVNARLLRETGEGP